jgi:hypothetical protein
MPSSRQDKAHDRGKASGRELAAPQTPSQLFAHKWDPRYLVLPPPPPRWHGPLHRAAIAATRGSIEEMNEIPGQPEPSPDGATLGTGVGPDARQQEVDPATAACLSAAMPDQRKDVFS